MSYSRFLEVHNLTAEFEGGWSNHPSDSGGATMYGVIQRVYDEYRRLKKLPKQTVRNITKKEALEIFYNNYWLAAKCDQLNMGVDRMVYDAAVNSGVGQSRKWLMRAIGGSDTQTIESLYSQRLAFMKVIKNKKTGERLWNVFGRGWQRRVDAMRQKALEEVSVKKAVQVPEVVKNEPTVKSEPKKSILERIIDIILSIFFFR